MDQILSKLESMPNWKETMKKTCRLNKLNIDIVGYFTPLRFRDAHLRFIKGHEKKREDIANRWLENQLRAFYWICVAISFLEGRKIIDFKEADWKLLQEIFYFKSPVTLEYEAKKLTAEIGSQTGWVPEEENFLLQIMQQQRQQLNKWNQKAHLLYEKSQGKYLRSGKQCRQKWFNNLNPQKNLGQWSLEEQRRLVQFILSNGKRWSKVARSLKSNRTEHMVKNRYKTLIGRLRRSYSSIKDEDTLLTRFLGNKQLKSIDNVDHFEKESKTQKDINLLDELYRQEKKENDAIKITEGSKTVLDELVDCLGSQNFEESQGVGPIGGNCGLQLPQVYSPWIAGMLQTPPLSPLVSGIINIPNFSSLDNTFSIDFYQSEKVEY